MARAFPFNRTSGGVRTFDTGVAARVGVADPAFVLRGWHHEEVVEVLREKMATGADYAQPEKA